MDESNTTINSSIASEPDMSVQFLGINCLPTSHKKVQTDVNENIDVGTSMSKDVRDTNESPIDKKNSVLTVNQKTQTSSDEANATKFRTRKSIGKALMCLFFLSCVQIMILKWIMEYLDESSALSTITKVIQRCNEIDETKSMSCIDNSEVPFHVLIETNIGLAFSLLSGFFYLILSQAILRKLCY